MTCPIVSVIIPCYNAEKNLVQCIDSICSQTLEQIEIICIDDGSDDATVEILRDYQKRDSRIQVIQQKNAGAGAARNVGLDRAAGEYLSFLDADDFFEPDMLEKAVAAAETWQADYIVFRSNRYYPGQDRYEEIPWSVRNADLPPYMPFSYRQLTDNVFLSFVGWAWDKLFRRSFVQAHDLRFQQQRTTNDMLFVFSALICAKRIGVIQDVLAHQRRGESDTLSVTREKSWHCFYDALIALRERLFRENIYWELEKDFINYSLHFCLWHLNSLAEPTHTMLKQKLCEEWFAELGITNKPESYFYSREEYTQYKRLVKAKNRKEKTEEKLPDHGIIPDGYVMNIGADSVSDLSSAAALWRKYDTLQTKLMKERKIWEQYQNDFWRRKYEHCFLACGRFPEAVSEQYMQRLCRELSRAQQLEQLDKRCFSQKDWRHIQKLISRADGKISLLKSVPVVYWLAQFVPKSMKRKIIHILKPEK